MSQSPELAGGAGFSFGDQVAVRYLASLLGELEGPGLSGRIVSRVALEQRDAGEPLDDIIIDACAPDGSTARLSLQVKRELTISAAASNSDFRDIVRDAWATLDKPDFRSGVDRVGAVTGSSVAAKKARDLQALADLARASASASDFERRFAPDGNASVDLRSILTDLQHVTRELGRSAEIADMWRLLAHFVLIKFDALHEGASDDALTAAFLRHSLATGYHDQSGLLQSRLQVLARTGAGRARSWSRDLLRLEVAPYFKLQATPSLAKDIERLLAFVRPATASIQDEVGGARIERDELRAGVEAKLKNHRFIHLRGLPGSGKSVLLKRFVDNALADGPALMLKSDRLEGGSWAQFARRIGLDETDPVPLLIELAAVGTPILFIDGLDRIDKTQRNIVVDLIEAIERTPELGSWRVLGTLRDAGIEPVRTWLPQLFDSGRVASVEVKGLNDDEARALGALRPTLRPLLMGTEPVRSLVRRPFFAKILDGAGLGREQAPRSEIELLAKWWRRGGYNAEGGAARLRQRALLRLARLRALNADAPVALMDVEDSLLPIIQELIDDGVLEDASDAHFVRFSHDIFFEWSFASLLASAGSDWPRVVKEAGEPPVIGRAVDLHSQGAFVADHQSWAVTLAALCDPQLRTQWRRVWLLAPIGHPGFAARVGQYDTIVCANNYALLKQALVWFQAQHTMPNPNLLDGTIGAEMERATRLRLADAMGWPDDIVLWSRFLSYVGMRLDDWPAFLFPHVLTLFEVWQHAAADWKNPVSGMIIEKVRCWLTELDARRRDRDRLFRKEARDRWDEIEDLDSFVSSLRSVLLRAARVEREKVAAYLSSLMGEDRFGRTIFDEVAGFSALLAETHPAELADFALRHFLRELPEDHRKRRWEEERRAAKRREELQRKQAEQLTRLEQMELSSPSLGYMGPDRFDWENLSVERDSSAYFPASPLHEPFASLLAENSDQALRLIKAMTNHAVEAWRQLHRLDHEAGTPIPLMLRFPWGRQTFWGGAREYLWSRGLWAPQPLESAYFALDRWSLAKVAEGADPDALIEQIVRDSTSIASLGIAVNVACASEHVSPVTEALVTSQRLWRADIQRCAQESSIRSSSQIGFTRPNQCKHAAAVEALNTHPVRQLDIRSLAMRHVLQQDKAAAERVREAIKGFAQALAYEVEEEKDHPGVQAAYAEQARTHAAWGHIEHYHLVDVPGAPEQKAVVLINPVADEPEVKARLEEGQRHLSAFALYHWAERSFEQRQVNERKSLEQAVEHAKAFDEPGLFDVREEEPDASMRQGGVAGTAAVVIAYGDDEHQAWANDVIARAARTPEPGGANWTSGSIINWHPCIFAARALGAMLRRDPADPQARERLLALVAHPLEGVMLEAARQLLLLVDVAPELAWNGFGLSLDVCQDEPGDTRSAYDPAKGAESRRRKAGTRIDANDETPTALPIPPGPWAKANATRRRRRPYYEDDESDEWELADGWWHSELASQILRLAPISAILAHKRLRPLFLAYCRSMLGWTIERTAPAWDERGRRTERQRDCHRWTSALASTLGTVIGDISAEEADREFLQPICKLKDQPCFALLEPLVTMFLCVHVLDAPSVAPVTDLVLQRALDRLLASRTFDRQSYRAGEMNGFEMPQLARWLMFCGFDHASNSTRFANGDWSDIALVLPTVDRFVRTAGWAKLVMSDFLELVERAHDHYPADAFADAVLSVLNQEPDPSLNWRATTIAARIAVRVQDMADRRGSLQLSLGQKLLRVLDKLVDQGDRRSAALQISPAFRDLRLH